MLSSNCITQQQFKGENSVVDPKSSDFQWELPNSAASFLTIRTDASKKGWGAVCQGIPTGGKWNLQEQQHHINVLEMKAVKLALLVCHKHFQMKAIHFQIGSTTALSYLVKIGGTTNKDLIKLAKEICKYLLHHGITITAKYLPSSMNVEADWQSRNSKDHSEWKLLLQVFQRICQIKGKPEMDLFASRLSAQLLRCIAWKPDPYSQGKMQCRKSGSISTFMQRVYFSRVVCRLGEFNIRCSLNFIHKIQITLQALCALM